MMEAVPSSAFPWNMNSMATTAIAWMKTPRINHGLTPMNTDQERTKPQSNRAKRLECAVFRRYACAGCKDFWNGRNKSAGIQRTPNASRRGEAHKVAQCLSVVLPCLLFFLLLTAFGTSAAT